jgi:hypothetical protein
VRGLVLAVELVFAATVAGILIFTYRTRPATVGGPEAIGSRSVAPTVLFTLAATAVGVMTLIITMIFPAFFIVDMIAAGILMLAYRRTRDIVRSIALVGIFMLVMIVAGVGILLNMLRPVTDVKSAVVQANQLMASAGGPTKVCDEAKQLFKRYEGLHGKDIWFTDADLADCPAIAALAKASRHGAVIEPGENRFPPRIEIWIGTRLDGYTIHIVDTTNPVRYPTSTYTAELVDSRIFVSRPDPGVKS